MRGSHLRFYTYENRKHKGLAVYEWLLERARDLGIHGGSAFRALAGFGHRGVMHEQHFVELAGEQSILIEFIADEDQADQFLTLINQEELAIFWMRSEVEYGTSGS
ncbi:MAG: DUF190 domain-containing protein [Dokdonella sp.]